jgi:hypothetical protein
LVKNSLQQRGNWHNEIQRNNNEIPKLAEYQLKKNISILQKRQFLKINPAKKYANKHIIVALSPCPSYPLPTNPLFF